MTDLSTRIEKVLAGCHAGGGTTFSALADAVIRELGLRQERRGPVTAYRDGQYYPDSSIVRVISDWGTQDD